MSAKLDVRWRLHGPCADAVSAVLGVQAAVGEDGGRGLGHGTAAERLQRVEQGAMNTTTGYLLLLPLPAWLMALPVRVVGWFIRWRRSL